MKAYFLFVDQAVAINLLSALCSLALSLLYLNPFLLNPECSRLYLTQILFITEDFILLVLLPHENGSLARPTLADMPDSTL